MCITAVTTAPADLAMGAKGQKIIINIIIIIVVVIDLLTFLLSVHLFYTDLFRRRWEKEIV